MFGCLVLICGNYLGRSRYGLVARGMNAEVPKAHETPMSSLPLLCGCCLSATAPGLGLPYKLPAAMLPTVMAMGSSSGTVSPMSSFFYKLPWS